MYTFSCTATCSDESRVYYILALYSLCVVNASLTVDGLQTRNNIIHPRYLTGPVCVVVVQAQIGPLGVSANQESGITAMTVDPPRMRVGLAENCRRSFPWSYLSPAATFSYSELPTTRAQILQAFYSRFGCASITPLCKKTTRRLANWAEYTEIKHTLVNPASFRLEMSICACVVFTCRSVSISIQL